MSSLPMFTDRCACTACGLRFTSTHAFDVHRVGKYATAERRCLTQVELALRKWAPNESGYWRLPFVPKGVELAQ